MLSKNANLGKIFKLDMTASKLQNIFLNTTLSFDQEVFINVFIKTEWRSSSFSNSHNFKLIYSLHVDFYCFKPSRLIIYFEYKAAWDLLN